MGNEKLDADIQKQILRSLREFYPIKVDEIVLITAVQKNVKDASIELITKCIGILKEKGWVEESVVKAPFGKTETIRLKITSTGIEYLQSLEEKEIKIEAIPAEKIETRLVETYDRIKSDMEGMRQGLETSQKTLELEMTEMRKRIADHDQVIRTYFVRVIETFGVFVGIFAVVVVVMLNFGQNIPGSEDWSTDIARSVLIMFGVPIVVTIAILAMLWGIRKLVLTAPK
jgi:DNA gyrase/topoisomerase IV subunit A